MLPQAAKHRRITAKSAITAHRKGLYIALRGCGVVQMHVTEPHHQPHHGVSDTPAMTAPVITPLIPPAYPRPQRQNIPGMSPGISAGGHRQQARRIGWGSSGSNRATQPEERWGIATARAGSTSVEIVGNDQPITVIGSARHRGGVRSSASTALLSVQLVESTSSPLDAIADDDEIESRKVFVGRFQSDAQADGIVQDARRVRNLFDLSPWQRVIESPSLFLRELEKISLRFVFSLLCLNRPKNSTV